MAAKGYSAGRVFLQVVPSYNNFMRALKRDARGALGKAIADTFEKELAKSGTSSGEAFGKNVSESIKKNIRTDALTEDLKRKLGKALDDVGDDTSKFGTKLKDLQRDIEQTGKVTDDHIKRQRDLAKEMLAASEATSSQAKAQRLLNASSNLDPGTARSYAQAQRDVARETQAAGRAAEQAERAERRRGNTLRDTDRDTNVAARGLGRLSAMLAGARGDSQDGANAFRFFNFAILAAATGGAGLIPVLAGVAGGLLVLGPILAGLGGGLGVLALGFSGVANAVKALSAQSDAASSSSGAYARSMVNAARAVADARRALKDAYRNSAEGIERAIESQRDAERSLADAQRDAKRAQLELTEARKQAAQEQLDLSNQIAQNNLDERQGVIDLFNAYNQFGAVMSDGGSTNLERESADIALKQAELNLKRIREEQKNLAEQKKKADKDGIEGSDTVVRATERLTDAIERQKDAQRRLQQATRDVSRARADGARSIADARRNLSRAQEDYNLAAQGGAEATNKVEEAMSKLSPAAQRFARYLFSLREGLAKLRAAAAEGLLPGVEAGMRRIIGVYGPGMLSFVRDMATDMGGLAVEVGKTFTNPVWRGFFHDMRDASRQFVADATRGTLGFMTGWAAVMDEALPLARKFSTYVREIGERFGTWAASDEGRSKIREFLGYVDRVGPKVRDFFVSFVKAIGNIGKSLAPVGESVLSFLTDILERISKLDEGQVRGIGVAILSVVVALQAASGILALISAAAAIASAPFLILVGAAVALGAAFFFLGRAGGKNSKTFKDLHKTLKPLIGAVKDLAKMFKEQLVKTWKQAVLPALRDIGKALKKDLLPAFKAFWPVIRPLVGLIVKLFGIYLRGAIMAAKDIIVGFIKVLSGLMNFIAGVFTGDWDRAWKGIKQIFFGLVQGIWGYFNLFIYGKLFGSFKKLFTKEMPGMLTAAKDFIVFAAKQPFKLIAAYFSFWKTVVLKTIKGAVGSIGVILGGIRSIANKVKGWFGDMKDNVVRVLGKMRDKAGDIMDDLRKKMSKPIVSVIDFVLNKGLIAGVNKLAGWVGQKGKDGKGVLSPIKLPKYATGGIIPGYTPGRDGHMINVGGGEAILRPEVTRGLGAGIINAWNKAAQRGGVQAVRNAIGGGVQAFAKGGIVWPTTTRALSGNYPGHTGVDIRAGMGSPVFAAHAGKVTATPRWNYSYGNHVRIRGTDGVQTIYGHLSKILTAVGRQVKAGSRIGNSGSTGNSTGPHLHFEVRPGGTRAAALRYLSGAGTVKGGGILDKLSGLSSEAINALKNPAKWLKDKVSGGFDRVGGLGGNLGTMLKAIPNKLADSLAGKIKDMAMKGLGVAKDFFVGAAGKAKDVVDFLNPLGGKGPKLYDNGGWLPPGLSMVMNKTQRPEPILTGDQWDAIMRGGGGGGDTWNITGHGADPDELARQLVNRIRFERRRIRRNGAAGKVVTP